MKFYTTIDAPITHLPEGYPVNIHLAVGQGNREDRSESIVMVITCGTHRYIYEIPVNAGKSGRASRKLLLVRALEFAHKWTSPGQLVIIYSRDEEIYRWFKEKHKEWITDIKKREYELIVQASNLYTPIRDRVEIRPENGSKDGKLAQDIALGKSLNVLRALNPMAYEELMQENPFRKDDPDERYRRALDKDD